MKRSAKNWTLILNFTLDSRLKVKEWS
jgi:hypothetical protein